MATTMQAIIFTDINQVSIGSYELGVCGPKEIVTRTLYSMVSSGTELRVLGGHYGAKGNYPLIPGYSTVGRVTAIGADVKGFRIGDLVSCRNPRPCPGIKAQWGGQASIQVHATSGEDRPILLPPDANPLDYVIAEISAISFRGVEAAAPKPGESAVVIGQGLIGAFSGAWLAARGCRVVVADVEPGRLARAVKWGAAATVNVTEAGAQERLATLCNGGADIVVESSGSSAGALLAYKLVRRKPQRYGTEYKVEPIAFYHQDWPRLIMQANYIEPISIDPFAFFDGEGITILAPKDRGVEDRQKVVEQIRRGAIKSADFVQNVLPFQEAPAAYRSLREDKNRCFSVVFDWTKA